MEEERKKTEKTDTPLTLLLKSPQKCSSSARCQTPLPIPQSLLTPITPSLNADTRPPIHLEKFNSAAETRGSTVRENWFRVNFTTDKFRVGRNVVGTVNLMSELDLRKINFCTRNTEYNPARFKGLVMRIREPQSTALIFKSGKVVVTGAKSEEALLLATRKYARIIQKLGFPIKFCNFKVQNIVGTCDVRFPIKLEALNQVHAQFSSYEPEIFPALIYRLVKSRVVLLIFVNGKIVLTGARTKQEIQEALEIMLPILKSFRKQ